MVSTMRFVGATVDELLKHGDNVAAECDITRAADAFLASLEPIGDSFDLPWKFSESLDILQCWLPDDLRERLTKPGGCPPENHLEASIVALALEAGVRLQPLTKNDMQRLQHVAKHATDNAAWGRQSPYPWDTVASASIDDYDFFALFAPT
jgi:hypothetical protein